MDRADVRRVALTGGIATGKSYVRARFEALGVPTIDADALARDAVAPGTAGLASVVARFGRHVLHPDGTLDRQRLADIVFADPESRLALEAIVHPEVRRATDRWFASLDAEQFPCAIADIPLLYEVGRDRDFDAVIVVACDPATQIRRLIARDGMSDAEARLRIGVQLPIHEKVRRANYVISTDGDYEETDRQVTRLFGVLFP
ncbi:MAG: dephospho-CoA kinase [Acidobacteria bacterium]|nr:dephospho-CoA kinase [Acidobacteriota bacterium]